MTEHFYAIIMAGGGGTRLWPLSRQDRPKQSLALVGEDSMFRVSVERLFPLFPPERIFVVTGQNHADDLRRDTPELPPQNFLMEPFGRESGPAAGLGTIHIATQDPDAVIAVLTADHHITDIEAFLNVLRSAYEVAQKGKIVTLGISPSYPSTGFGYIKRGELIETVGGYKVYQAEGFREKPDHTTAIEFLTSGQYSWNAGMFIWKASQALAEFEKQKPGIYQNLQTIRQAYGTPEYTAVIEKVWPDMEKISLDYAIMEKAANVAVIPADIGWSDIGSWSALYEVLHIERGDDQQNVLHSKDTNAIMLDTTGTLILSNRLVVTIGVENLVIVDTEDALLICHRDKAQDIRAVVKQLQETGKKNLL
ncbi:MAG: mannose-1-phosphate guanylyltransferase [Chloroflexi bacterium]|nr:mannose-1-phosphate guanylyltransferase [Chloroflexota bacterium]